MVQRVSTGIKGLDELVEGGYPAGYTILYSGSPGTGKSIAAMQFLAEGVKKGEPGVYVSIEEPKEKIIDQAAAFGWDFAKAIKDGKLIIMEYKELVYSGEHLPIKPEDEESRKKLLLRNLREARDKINAKRLVIDSLSSYTFVDGVQERGYIRDLFDEIGRLGVTTILTSELLEGQYGYSRDTVSEFLADGLLVIHLESLGAQSNRTLTIRKMRITKHSEITNSIEITKKGIQLESQEDNK